MTFLPIIAPFNPLAAHILNDPKVQRELANHIPCDRGSPVKSDAKSQARLGQLKAGCLAGQRVPANQETKAPLMLVESSPPPLSKGDFLGNLAGTLQKGRYREKVQAGLTALGYDIGPYGIDNVIGDDTRVAIRNFIKDYNAGEFDVDGNDPKHKLSAKSEDLPKAYALIVQLGQKQNKIDTMFERSRNSPK